MRFLASLRAALVAVSLVVTTVAFAPAAYAGTLRVEDDAGDLTSQSIQQIQRVVAGAPFDGRLVVTTRYEDAQDLSRYVGTLVTSPDLVVVGLDPAHRHVQVHFGTGSGVARSEWANIERAGNDDFRKADWAGGAAAIFRTAAQSTSGEVAPQAGRPAAQPVVGHSFFGMALTMFLLIAVAAIAIGFFARRRSYGGGYGQPPYGGPGYGGPGYPQGYGAPGGGMGPVGGGLIGAGLGGLAGYELGKAEGEREERDHDRGDWGRDRGDDGGSSGGNDGNYDAGGGGSSWDGGGGNDGGGFDGGGGSDGGGGGGSDF
jgi:hypothetical protein